MIIRVTDEDVITCIPVRQIICWQIFEKPIKKVNSRTGESRDAYGKIIVPIQGAVLIWNKEETDMIANMLAITME